MSEPTPAAPRVVPMETASGDPIDVTIWPPPETPAAGERGEMAHCMPPNNLQLLADDARQAIIDDLRAQLATAERDLAAMTAERDDARGNMASIADAVNGWVRELGGTQETPDANMANVREAINRIGYRANGFRLDADDLRAELARTRESHDHLRRTLDAVRVAAAQVAFDTDVVRFAARILALVAQEQGE